MGACLGSFWHQDASAARTPKRVGIVGAGIAGLSAAQSLKEKGHDVFILEARERIGGRIWTSSGLGTPIDLGASWIHGTTRDNPLMKLSRKWNIKTFETDHDSVRLWDEAGKMVSQETVDAADEKLHAVIKRIAKKYENSARDKSFLAAIQESDQKHLEDPIFKWALTSEFEFDMGAPLSELSARTSEADELYSETDAIVVDGYDSVATALAKGLNIQTKKVVKSISVSEKEVQIATDGEKFPCDYAVVTVPLSILQNGSIEFTPVLSSAKKELLKKFGMGSVNKIAVKFPAVFWDEKPHFLGFVDPIPGHYALCLNYFPILKQPILVFFALGEYATRMESESDDAILSQIVVKLKKIYGEKYVSYTAFQVTRWMQDPFSQGVYSYPKVGSQISDRKEWEQSHSSRVFFAGEHTHSQFPGTVHGAFLSGQRAANQIVSSTKN